MSRNVDGVIVNEVRKHGGGNNLDDETLLAQQLEQLFDSLSMLEVIMNVEDHYNIRIDESAVRKCQTVKDVVALVERALTGTN